MNDFEVSPGVDLNLARKFAAAVGCDEVVEQITAALRWIDTPQLALTRVNRAIFALDNFQSARQRLCLSFLMEAHRKLDAAAAEARREMGWVE